MSRLTDPPSFRGSSSGPPDLGQTESQGEYIRQPGEMSEQKTDLARLIVLAQGQHDPSRAAKILLVGLTAPDGFQAPCAAILERDQRANELVGVDAVQTASRIGLEELFDSMGAPPIERRAVSRLLSAASRRTVRRMRAVRFDAGETDHPLVACLDRARPTSIHRLEEDDRLVSLAAILGEGPVACLPICARRRCLGLVVVRPDPTDRFSLRKMHEWVARFTVILARLGFGESGEGAHRAVDAIDRLTGGALATARLDEVLAAAVRETVSLAEGAAGAVWMFDRRADRLRLATQWEQRSLGHTDWLRQAGEIAEKAYRSGQEVERNGERVLEVGQLHTLLLIAHGETVGVLSVMTKPETDAGSDPWAASEKLLRVMARLTAGYVQTASLFRALQESRGQSQEAQRWLVRAEKLASIGELSQKAANEISVSVSEGRAALLRIENKQAEDDPCRSDLLLLKRELERIAEVLEEQNDLTQTEGPRLRMTNLIGLLRQAIGSIREEAKSRGVQLIEHGAGGLPEMLLDPDRIRQVLTNVLKNALQSSQRGEQVRVQARALEGWVQIEVVIEGEQRPGEVLDRLFVPFATAHEGGHGLGLAVADRIVKEHGGEIRCRSSEEGSTLMTISLPVRSNDDRRRAGERRRGQDRRRVA